MDKPHDRIDTRFPCLRFPRRDTLLRSTPLHREQRKGMVCVRTFFFWDSPLQPSFDSPLLSSFRLLRSLEVLPILDVATSQHRREGVEGNSLQRASYRNYVFSVNCMQASKRRLHAKPRFLRIFGRLRKKTNCPSVNRLSQCQHVDCSYDSNSLN